MQVYILLLEFSSVPSAVSDAVQQKFPESSIGEIRQAMRQKCSNAVKYLKYKSVAATATSDVNKTFLGIWIYTELKIL